MCQTYGDVRLRGNSASSGTGIVEIYLNGEWGTVQATDYDYSGVGDAVCRQLGYDPYSAGTFETMK